MDAISPMGLTFGILSALSWGSSDFSGGVASRRLNSFQTLVIGATVGLGLLSVFAWLRGERLPTGVSLAWACGAGVVGALGIAALYHGLSVARAAVVAPTSAVVGAAFPVLVGLWMAGLPDPGTMLGFVLGAVGIGLVARPSEPRSSDGRHGLGPGVLAGLGFGGFFVLIAQTTSAGVFAPLVVSKVASLFVGLLFLAWTRQPFPSIRENPMAMIAGVLDVGGNVFYMLANQYTRLDVAAVLASMYPAATVVLTALIFKERVSLSQWMGVIACVAAVSLMAS